MKKRIQKYLSGSNEGFSLVELIIVIAIMAILVGVVALAVIPYLEKSRESKDLQALDTVASAVTTAIADKQITGSGTFSLTTSAGDWGQSASGEDGKIGDDGKITEAVATTMGKAVPTFSSNNAKGKAVSVYYNSKANAIVVYLKADTSNDTHTSAVTTEADSVFRETVSACKYNDNAKFCVSNVKIDGTVVAKQ